MKLESLGLTIAGIAHDLNTPIGVAITASSHLEQVAGQFAERANETAPTSSEVQRFVDRLRRAVELVRGNLNKAAVLVRSFKQTTADATRTEWRDVNLKSFLETLVVSVSPLMKRARCEVTLNCPEHIGLKTEPGSLARALTNLLLNATIHAFEGREDRHVRIDVQTTAAGVRITCADNGVGMSEEAVTKAFTPFFTTRRGAGGSGLGLFSSRRAVEQVLGGKLTMVSVLGAGTTFHIDLPLSISDERAR
jgi:signal transduction histidine kinase